MRNFQLETMFTDQDHDLRVAFRIGGVGGPAPQRGGVGAFDGTGHSPSGPGKPHGKKAEGRIIHRGTGDVHLPSHAKGQNEAEAQARTGASIMGSKPRGGLRAV